MLIFFAYTLGYLTAFLEFHGMTKSAVLSGLISLVLIFVRLAAGMMLQPTGKRVYRWAKKENTRLERVAFFVLHYAQDHPGHHRGCQSCSGRVASS